MSFRSKVRMSSDKYLDQDLDSEKRFRKRVDFFINHVMIPESSTILVVGCGNGYEALCMQNRSRSFVVGLDLNLTQKAGHAQGVDYIHADAQHLPIRTKVLDCCYCYHAIEHVGDHHKLIDETSRVLKTEGTLYLATPNRNRLIGYIMSAHAHSLSTLIRWNLREWFARLKGDFLPEKGYHCGFTAKQLYQSLTLRFAKICFLSEQYDLEMAAGTKYIPLVQLLKNTHLLQVIAPSHTLYCQEPLA